MDAPHDWTSASEPGVAILTVEDVLDSIAWSLDFSVLQLVHTARIPSTSVPLARMSWTCCTGQFCLERPYGLDVLTIGSSLSSRSE